MLMLGLFGLFFMVLAIILRKQGLLRDGIDWNTCTLLQVGELGCFILEKLILVWYSFRSRCRAEQEAADIMVFDLHIFRLSYLMCVPLGLLFVHFLEPKRCYLPGSPYLNPPLLLGIQSASELIFITIYLRKHQVHLKTQEGCA